MSRHCLLHQIFELVSVLFDRTHGSLAPAPINTNASEAKEQHKIHSNHLQSIKTIVKKYIIYTKSITTHTRLNTFSTIINQKIDNDKRSKPTNTAIIIWTNIKIERLIEMGKMHAAEINYIIIGLDKRRFMCLCCWILLLIALFLKIIFAWDPTFWRALYGFFNAGYL